MQSPNDAAENLAITNRWRKTLHTGVVDDNAETSPQQIGFDEIKEFSAYHPGVCTYDDISWFADPWFPKFNPEYGRWMRASSTYTSGKVPRANPRPRSCGLFGRPTLRWNTSRRLPGDKPFYMDVNFMKMDNPNNPAKAFIGTNFAMEN
jgi:hypothetical protein